MHQFSWPSPAASALVAAPLVVLPALLPAGWALPQPSPPSVLDARDRCDELQARHLARGDLIVTNVSYVDARALNISGTQNDISFCRLSSRLAYGGNHSLNFEVWLPGHVEYNGRYLAVGNSGMAGVIDTFTMVDYLNEGFAVAGGDSGHLAVDNNDGDGAPNTYLPYLHDRDQVLAWIHNSVAMFTPPAREFVSSYYGNEPSYSYYYGCSTGGAQGFALSQLHPELFDGIYAGCPGFWYSHLALSFLWNAQQTAGDAYLNQTLLDAITSAVIDQCDAIDGVTDRLLEDPLKCSFNIDSLACGAVDSNSSACLTPAQVVAAKAVYGGPRDARNGTIVYPGFSVGSEIEWAQGQEGSLAEAFSVPILQNLVFDNLNYSADAFNWGSDIDKVDQNAGLLIDETSTNLTAFRQGGGKMLVSQGWADPYNAATLPIDYLQRVQAFFGGDVSDFFNVFMVPGGGHCGAASGYPHVPAKHHVIDALRAWVESGVVPDSVLSDTPEDGGDRTRKLCAWPKTAQYLGGDVESAASYRCA